MDKNLKYNTRKPGNHLRNFLGWAKDFYRNKNYHIHPKKRFLDF